MKDLRGFLKILEDEGLLRRFKEEVDPRFEIAAHHMKAQMEKGPAILFENVKGHDMPVVANLLGTRQRLALALGLPKETSREMINDDVRRRARIPGSTNTVSDAPCKEVVLEGDQLDLRKLPAPVIHEKDAGPYITAGMVIARDPETGVGNVSIHRLQVKGKKRLGILIEPRHLFQLVRRANEANRPLEVAIAIGAHPIIYMAALAGLPLGEDEFAFAGALAGEPTEMVKCESVDLKVPACSEIVLEGEIPPGVLEVEGPFAEYTGYYAPAGPRQVVEVKTVTHRSDAIFYTMISRSTELAMYHVCKYVKTYDAIKSVVPTLQRIYFPETYWLIVSIKKTRRGEARNAMLAAMNSSDVIKHVIVVDDDIQVDNLREVLWAIATRFQADKDLLLIKRTWGASLDPSSDRGVWTMMGIDATKPLGKPYPERARIPTLEELNVEGRRKARRSFRQRT